MKKGDKRTNLRRIVEPRHFADVKPLSWCEPSCRRRRSFCSDCLNSGLIYSLTDRLTTD